MKWRSEKGAFYTIMMNDFGIERLQGAQYFHWMVANIPADYSKDSGVGEEVQKLPYIKIIKISPWVVKIFC